MSATPAPKRPFVLLDPDPRRVGALFLAVAVFGLTSFAALRLPSLLGLTGPAAAAALHASDLVAVLVLVVPALAAILGTWALPERLGARGLAFPRLQLAAFHLYAVSVLLLVAALALRDDGLHTRWLLFMAYDASVTGRWVVALLGAVLTLGVSLIFSSLNALATVHGMKRRGLGFGGLSPLVWGLYAHAVVVAVAAPVLCTTAILTLAERGLGLGLFTPANGGDALLYRHLFWFGMHPLLLTSVLPALGLALEVLARRGDAPPAATPMQRRAMLGLALLAPLGWGQHAFATGMSAYAAMVFSFFALLAVGPLVYLLVSAARTFGGAPAARRPAALPALAVVALVTALAALAMAAGSVGVAASFDVVLFGRLGVDLLVGVTAAGLLATWLEVRGAPARVPAGEAAPAAA